MRRPRVARFILAVAVITCLSLIFRFWNTSHVGQMVSSMLSEDNKGSVFQQEDSQESTTELLKTGSLPEDKNGSVFLQEDDIESAIKSQPLWQTEKVTLLKKAKAQIVGVGSGAYPTVTQMLNPRSIIYSFGIGEDPSWEMDLLRKVDKVRIYAFDGTPGASYILPHANPSEFVTDYEEQYAEEFENPKKVKRRRLPGRISFRRYTLARSTRGQRLYFMKKIPTNNSVGEKEKEIFTLSRETIVGYKALWSVRIYGRTLSNIMNLMTHNRIDLLKLSIDGLELPMFRAWAQHQVNLPICQLLVDFLEQDNLEGMPTWREGISVLRNSGFLVVKCHPETNEGNKKCVFLSSKHCNLDLLKTNR